MWSLIKSHHIWFNCQRPQWFFVFDTKKLVASVLFAANGRSKGSIAQDSFFFNGWGKSEKKKNEGFTFWTQHWTHLSEKNKKSHSLSDFIHSLQKLPVHINLQVMKAQHTLHVYKTLHNLQFSFFDAKRNLKMIFFPTQKMPMVAEGNTSSEDQPSQNWSFVTLTASTENVQRETLLSGGVNFCGRYTSNNDVGASFLWRRQVDIIRSVCRALYITSTVASFPPFL